MKPAHQHYWYYVHAVISANKRGSPDRCAIVRYCDCRRREVAFTQPWRKATGDYALDDHYPMREVE